MVIGPSIRKHWAYAKNIVVISHVPYSHKLVGFPKLL